ncbi:MAG TPA: DUF4468 domain-containing protein [Mucilaginibacter sp.]|nr:DUF4468 domain-containing protein [Mucilaginibacter sp.]
MKHLTIAFVLVILCLSVKAQDYKFEMTNDSLIVSKNVVSLQDTQNTKSHLYKNAKIWIANEFRSLKDVVQIDDPESGHIIGKGSTLCTNGMLRFNYTFDIMVKDQKYQMIIKNASFYYSTDDTELLTSVYKEYLTNLIKHPRRARFNYSYRFDEAKRIFASLQTDLNKAMSENNSTDF